jgi:hypothetical protein
MKQSSRACGFLVVIESNSGVTKAQSDTAWEKNQMDGGIMEPWLHDRLGKKTKKKQTNELDLLYYSRLF